MSTESPTGSVGSQDPMEPAQNTKTVTDQGPLPITEPADTGHPFEGGHEAGAAHEVETAHGTEIVPETETAHEDEDEEPTHGVGTAHEAEAAYAIEAAHETAEEAGLTPAEGLAEDAFYTMAADLQQTLDEIEMERRAPSPVPDRRSEMTPGRVVHFEPAAMSPDSRESKL
eukprot:1824445-Rhodomonas_salina.1